MRFVLLMLLYTLGPLVLQSPRDVGRTSNTEQYSPMGVLAISNNKTLIRQI